jgi:adenylate kinase family enzyme
VTTEVPTPSGPVTRIAVHGASGSGKTTLATALAARLGVARTELDALFHQSGWTELPDDEFRAEVAVRVAEAGWVVDGNYRAVRDLVWARAQLIVVLDLPRWRVLAQLLRRTVTRGATRAELWNGNRESLRNLVSTDDGRNVVLWSWRTHHRYHDEVPAEARSAAPHARVMVLRDRRSADALPGQMARGEV